MDGERWRERLEELIVEHDVPGMSVAVLADGAVTAFAAGVLHRGTGVAATTDSLFQIGSITKVYTATLLLRLIDPSPATVDTPVAEILPGFRVADPDASRRVTLRHLLTHTGGFEGDFFHDTGRGDECVERYVAACADLPQILPPGEMISYCNSGYVILGRVIEKLTGTGWDAALAEHLVRPLGLTHTWTLPEDVVRFRAATGHDLDPARGTAEPVTTWSLPRSAGPAGLICATASDVVAFARLHLDGGRAPDGTAVLDPGTVAAMQERQHPMPFPQARPDAWGLGWMLFDWEGRRVFGHDGSTIGQTATLRVVPDAGVAVALLANSEHSIGARHALLTELFADLCDVSVPPAPQPPADPVPVDPDRFAGVYERAGSRLEITAVDGELRLLATTSGDLAGVLPDQHWTLVPCGEDLLLGRADGFPVWSHLFVDRRPDGRVFLHTGARVTPKIR